MSTWMAARGMFLSIKILFEFVTLLWYDWWKSVTQACSQILTHSAMTLPPTPTQYSLLDVGVADVALSAFVAPSVVYPSSIGSQQCQDLWSFVHRWHCLPRWQHLYWNIRSCLQQPTIRNQTWSVWQWWLSFRSPRWRSFCFLLCQPKDSWNVTPHIVRKYNLSFLVNISCKATLASTLRARISVAHLVFL